MAPSLSLLTEHTKEKPSEGKAPMADVSKPGEASPEVNSQQPDVGLAASRK